MAKWVNTVPQGVAGTGNATIYGANPVAAQFGNQLALLRERESQQELLQQKEAEKLAKSFRDNQLAASEGRLWADQIGKIEQDHYQKGIELQQQGIDLNGINSKALDYQKERRSVQSQQGYRKSTENRLNETIKLIQANPNKYEPEDIKSVNDFFVNTKLDNAYNGNVALPQLRERYSPGAAVKDLKAITQNYVDVKGNVKSDKKFLDKEATENMIIGRFMSDPKGIEFLNKMSGGIPINELRKMPKTIEANREAVINEYNGSRQLRQKLASEAGIVGEGEKFNQWVDEMARVRTSSKNSFDNQMDSYVANASNGMMLWDRNTPDFGQANYDLKVRNANSADRKESRLSSNASAGGGFDAPQNLPLYYGKDGKEAVTGLGVVKIGTTEQNYQGSPAYDLLENKFTDIRESASEFETVSIGNYPLAKARIKLPNGQIIEKGGLVGDNFANKRSDLVTLTPRLLVSSKSGYKYLIDPKNMPKNKLTKKDEGILATFIPAGSGKSYSESQEKLIKDNLKANPAYNREEIIKALGL